MNALNTRPTRGDFNIPNAQIIQPGDPYSSTLYFRMAKFGRDRMPHIGSDVPDENGLRLIELWIAQLNSHASTTETFDTARPESWLANPRSAMLAARKLARGELNDSERQQLVKLAAELPIGPMRDLFDGYLPADGPSQRKLGSSPRPKSILAVQGSAERGETLFWSQAVNCGKCHRVGDRGAPVGPDLSTIGGLRSRDDLLDSLLSPSRRIEPKFAAYIAQTTDGRLLNGLLVKRDEQAVILRDQQAAEVRVPASEVHELRPVRTSLMPEGQMSGLTVQEAADLLEYLVTRK
jgi:putative heme-binding domain-containing protein